MSSEENICCVCTSIKNACINGHDICFDFYYHTECIKNINKLYKLPTGSAYDGGWGGNGKYTRETLLHITCLSGNTHLVKKLLNINFNPNIKNSNGLTPLEIICRGLDSFSDYQKYRKKVRYDNIIFLLLQNERITIPTTAFGDFLINVVYIDFKHADSYSDKFNIRKKMCILFYEIIKLFLIKKANFQSSSDIYPMNILNFIMSRKSKFGEIARCAAQEWTDIHLDLNNENVIRHHLLYLALVYGYISYEDCEKYKEMYGWRNEEYNVIEKIVELWKAEWWNTKECD